MKIKEILEMSQQETLEEIAKNHLTIGLKRLRVALKAAGCYNIRGVKGWRYEGDPAILEQSVYNFIGNSQLIASKTKQKESAGGYNASINKVIISEQKATTKQKESELDNIDKLLFQNETDRGDRVYRGFYWDREIIDFLDSIKHGNKSDLMNEIVKSVLKNKGLL